MEKNNGWGYCVSKSKNISANDSWCNDTSAVNRENRENGKKTMDGGIVFRSPKTY